MAQLLRIRREVEDFAIIYLRRHSLAEENRVRENRAATIIQSRFRGCKVRAYLRHLHKKALVIQKSWRGFTARARFRRAVKDRYLIMKMELYHEMALRIQCRWRGFYVRKYIHDFYARKDYLQRLSVHNELVRSELEEHEQLHRRQKDFLQKVQEQREQLYRAHRLHHLLSTKQSPGVFNSPFRSAPHETELLLRQVKYQTSSRRPPGDRTCLSGMEETTHTFSETWGSNWIRHGSCNSSQLKLPPILGRNQQSAGAEPEAEEVWDPAPVGTNLDRSQNQNHQHKSGRFFNRTM